ncbi:MAG: XdhC family protein [Anaerolineales bacterium]|nr:XdhC family protein [Anaerolineales bacterium]
MRDILLDIDRWLAEGEKVALATVAQTWGSSPRPAGAKMAVTATGRMTGSVSGGCVEGAVVEESLAALKSGRPRLVHFGVADETAWEVGLACGGSIDVFVQPLERELYAHLRALLAAERVFAAATLVTGPAAQLGRVRVVAEDGGVFGDLDPVLADAPARAALAAGQTTRQPVPGGELFIEVAWPAPTLVVVGGVHTSIALTALAKTLGYRTIVVDPRKAFGSAERFPHVDRLIQKWPDEALAEIGLSRATAVALLTHDPKLDDPGLKQALPSQAFYVGALGSASTQAKRRARLLADGLTEAQLDRLRGPIGLDLGGRTPEEVALAILAEVVAARNGKLGPAGARSPGVSTR